MEGALKTASKVLLGMSVIGLVYLVAWMIVNWPGSAHPTELPSSLLSPHTDIPPEHFEQGKMWMGRFHVIGRSPCWKPIFIYPVGDKWQWDEQ